MTANMKDDLVGVGPGRPAERRAEVTALLRFGGGLEVGSGQVVVAAELDHLGAARRLRAALADLYGHDSELVTVRAGHRHREEHYVVRVTRRAEILARQAGLLDGRGRPVQGLPAALVNGTLADAQAVWRGAILARGSVSGPGRSTALTVACPGFEAALALVGAARRLGITAHAGQGGGTDRVVVRKASAISALLGQVGAHHTVADWTQQQQAYRAARLTAPQPAGLGNANAERSARAASVAAARVQRALDLLGEDVPPLLKAAGQLRVKHRDVSLEQLGRLADPPLNKDTIAGRIRRLLALADQHGAGEGTPAPPE